MLPLKALAILVPGKNGLCGSGSGSNSVSGPSCPLRNREVLNGVGADGVGVKIPIFSVDCSCLLFCPRRRNPKNLLRPFLGNNLARQKTTSKIKNNNAL